MKNIGAKKSLTWPAASNGVSTRVIFKHKFWGNEAYDDRFRNLRSLPPTDRVTSPWFLVTMSFIERPRLSRERRYHPYHLLEDNTVHNAEDSHPTVHRSIAALLLGALILSLFVNVFLSIHFYHSRYHATYHTPQPNGELLVKIDYTPRSNCSSWLESRPGVKG